MGLRLQLIRLAMLSKICKHEEMSAFSADWPKYATSISFVTYFASKNLNFINRDDDMVVFIRGAARGKLMVATASSMEFRLAATSGRKLHARIHDDAAAASRHSMKVAFSDSL